MRVERTITKVMRTNFGVVAWGLPKVEEEYMYSTSN